MGRAREVSWAKKAGKRFARAKKPSRRLRVTNVYAVNQVKAYRREAIEDLAEKLARSPWSVTPSTLANLCGVHRSTVRKLIQAGKLKELRHALLGGRDLVLVNLREALDVLC